MKKPDSIVSRQLSFAFVGMGQGECHLLWSWADVRFLPFLLWAKLSLLCPATIAVRQPGYLLHASQVGGP